ncbi:golgin subfamily A member 5 [Gouania willdenowi]|uniref:Golgin subfamily A member 5-like n=1 Tax=Gouania willdenowi TaxID=441366 RepID=A0A8C5DCQ4_GOUWI|nr:golgin subfamily A member 5-like [Gouania willdenowi]XP_028327477.1 golgin subfamily A member 5-like [Gouania willdenowi]
MSPKRKTDLCRICGGALQGNQRRWLFGSQSRRTATSRRAGSLPRSLQSSPWGSTLSLHSSGSLSKSQQSLTSSSKGVDPLAVLTHILGQPVPRGDQLGEFICGKCVSLLERVFKFDSVLERVRVLSYERLQKLTQERDKIRRWVRQNYQQRDPHTARVHGSTSEDDCDEEKDAYREILRDNMALSEYECWSEKWDTCPYFIRTGKRCTKGKGCEGCDSLRVSDSDYESVCGVPRHLPLQVYTTLSRDKSRSMPLHWHRIPSVSSSPASLASSTLSLRPSSRKQSVQSLDSLDGSDPFDFLYDPSVDLMLRELRGIEGKPVSSPLGSRIPVLGRRDRRYADDAGESVSLSPVVSRTLSFGDVENGDDLTGGEDGDVLTELRDEFMSLHQENASGRVHQAIRHLRGQLDQAQARIRTLEAELQQGQSKPPEVNGSEESTNLVQEEGGSSVLLGLGHSLHSRERLIQECLTLVGGLYLKDGAGPQQANKLTQEVTANLQEILSDNKAALQALRSELKEKEHRLEEEVEALRRTGRDQRRDLDTLNLVLLCNQDVINDLREALLEKETQLKEVEKERELWRRRDGALNAVLQEKETLIRHYRDQLEVVSSSAIGQQSAVGGAEATAWQKDREAESALLCLEVTKLTAELQEYQDMVQTQQQSHSRTVCALNQQLQEVRQQLMEKEKQKKEAHRELQEEREERRREEGRLRESLRNRDKLIEQILLDAEQRDQLIHELQQNKHQPLTAVKHTL